MTHETSSHSPLPTVSLHRSNPIQLNSISLSSSTPATPCPAASTRCRRDNGRTNNIYIESYNNPTKVPAQTHPQPPPAQSAAEPATTTPRRRKKRVDSFAQLAAATPLPSPLSSPGLQAESEAESESLLTRVSPCQPVSMVHDPSNAPLDPPHSPLLHFISTLAFPRKPS
jgi:hypothetical protein